MYRVVIASAEGKAKAELPNSEIDPKHAERVLAAADHALEASWAAKADEKTAVAAVAASQAASDAAAAVAAARNAAEARQHATAEQAASPTTPEVVYLFPLSEWE